VILVGNNPSSLIYVSNKIKMANRFGIETKLFHFEEDATLDDLFIEIDKLNIDPEVTGILVQLPLPAHIAPRDLLDIIDPLKDVDGLHPLNMGMLYEGDETSALIPCTPQGCIHLIESSGIHIEGKKALVMGRSLIVGKPLSLMLASRGATVTMAHSKTIDLEKEIEQADILVSAIGKPEFIQGNIIKKGAVAIDVGISRLESGELKGDIDFESAKLKAMAITPVPGGVGPMTIAYLMKNILKAKHLQYMHGK
jgi:methylenetetrahydrofolate dehydrogenase (NADP+)/methenyltetrahydrofolate cyclohydrolase